MRVVAKTVYYNDYGKKQGKYQMKITGIECFTIDLHEAFKKNLVEEKVLRRGPRNFIFIKLMTDEGIAGYGETSELPFSLSTAAKLFDELVQETMIGTSPFDVETAFRKIYSHRYRPGRPERTLMGLSSAIDMACWDIVGKITGQPVYNLLGGKYNEKLRSYSYVFADHRDKKQWVETLQKYVEMGFTAVKFDPIPGPFSPKMLTLEEIKYFDELMKITRETIGTKCDILVGTHGQFTVAEAVRLAKIFEPYNPLWYEEPVGPDNPEGIALVARSTSIPVAAGERLATKYEFQQLFNKNAVGIAQFDMGRVGSMLEAKKVAGMAECCHVVTAPHVYASSILASASIQIDVCSPNFLIQESIFDWGGFHADILKEPIKWEKGYIIPSEKPGLGYELNEEYAKRLMNA